jgi:hypothetical protein
MEPKMLSRKDLMSLEEYSENRNKFRQQVISHKRDRCVMLGNHVRLIFEDQLTIQYQIQEMLRVEKIFDTIGIQEELDAYNPLIPDGDNWKATMMIEYPDIEERKKMLAELVNIEDLTWVQIDGFGKVMAIADEDMERSTEAKTSSVHFLRFQLTPEMVLSVQESGQISAGIDHPRYRVELRPLPPNIGASLVSDLA